MNKDQLRTDMATARRCLSDDALESMSQAINSNLLAWLESSYQSCMGFLSIQNEPSILKTLKVLNAKNILIAHPQIIKGAIQPIGFNPNESFSLTKFGNLKQEKINPVAKDVDLCLIPGLAFDRTGNRLGFGKGHWDRFLNSSKAIKVGICFHFQIVSDVPTDPWDIPMDYLITDQEVIRCGS